MKKEFIFVSLLMLFSAQSNAVINIPACPDKVTYHQGSACTEAGWIRVHIEGEAYERGFQHGYLLSKTLADFKKTIAFSMEQDTNQQWEYWIKQSIKYFAPHLDPEMLDEMKGIAAGATKAGTPLTWQDVLALNANQELNHYWWPKHQSLKHLHKGRCTALVATGSSTPDHKVIMAHDTVDNYITARFQNIVLDEKPAKGHRIFMQTMPGYLTSASDFFMTDAGIMGTETTIEEIKTENYNFDKSPSFVRIRRAMQFGNTLQDWVKLVSAGNNGGVANTWLLADMNTQHIMVLDLSYPHTYVEEKTDGYYAVHNNPYSAKIAEEDTTWSLKQYREINNHIGSRGARLKTLLAKYVGKLNIDNVKQIFADKYDPFVKRDRLGYRSIEAHGEFESGIDFPDYDSYTPYEPLGSTDAKVMTSDMAKQWSFWARWGNASGMPFDATAFFKQHRQWRYEKHYVSSVPSEPWIIITNKMD